jgi:hypothetical protein
MTAKPEAKELEGKWTGFGDLPQLDSIIAYESTDDGWRALTANGELFEIHGQDGRRAEVPDDNNILVVRAGKAIGRRAIEQRGFKIDDYITHFDQAAALFRSGKTQEALAESDAVIALAPTLRARFNRAFVLLTLGQWTEGLAEYEICERDSPFLRPKTREALQAGIKPWRGEDLTGKRLLLLHDHGLGDTIQMLRYVPALQVMGADVVMMVPPELMRLAMQVGTVIANTMRVIEADYVCSFLHLLHWLRVMPGMVVGSSYLKVDPMLRHKWVERLGGSKQLRIGLAWSVGVIYQDDYPRAIPFDELFDSLDVETELYSLQTQSPPAFWEQGIYSFKFEDFADCAALMTCMDKIISVDTAALHLAGAIGHPQVYGLLSHWHSWRWLANWYSNVKLCRQTTPGDWNSALEQIK